MTTKIRNSGPPIPPPRHAKEFYENEQSKEKLVVPPITPKRMSSKFSSYHERNNILKNNEKSELEKNTSANILINNKEYDNIKEFEIGSFEKEIMKDFNILSDHFKLSEDKLTLYEEENDDRKSENLDESNALKSLSSLTINAENNVKENIIQDIPSDSDSFNTIPSNRGSPVIFENKSVEPHQTSSSLQQEIIPVKEHHKKSKSSKSKSKSKSSLKTKEEKKKLKDDKKKSKDEKKKSKKSSSLSSQPVNNNYNNNNNNDININNNNKNYNNEIEQEIMSLKNKEKAQREFIIREQEKLNDLNQKQYLLLKHQYNLAINQKKQYSLVAQNNNLEQLAALQQQHERESASLQQNQNDLVQQVISQQHTITDAIDVHNTIIKKIISYTGESAENYSIPTPQQTPKQVPPQDSSNSSSPTNNARKAHSPDIGSPMSPALNINNSYYDEGVYSVSGFSVASGNTSISEDLESVSTILTDQLQQSINRRPTFRKTSFGGNNYTQKVRIGGSDPDTFQTTLNAYRQNVKNATDPGLQFEYAKFLIEAANDQYENGSTASSIQNKNDLFDEGFKFLKKLSNSGYPDAQHYLATCYEQDGDWDKAYPLFVQAAKHNHPVASYEIATYYESKKNYKKASQYYKKSASQGYSKAMHRLGCAALRGEMHMRKDVKNAIKWLKRAAAVATKENNGAASAYVLSELFENGMPPVIYPDELYSLELLVQAAELDYPPAQYKLGWCFEYGELGCPTDAVQSIHWFLLAAENDEPNAQFSLAGWYLTGAEGVIEPNDREAFYWAMKAAEQEYDKAEYAIAYFYEMGIGIEKNMKEAMHWYQIAAEHGDERAIKRLENEEGISHDKSSGNDCRIA